MPTDLQNANLGLGGAVFDAVCSTQAAAADSANALFEQESYYLKTADDGAAATNTAEFVIQSVPRRAMLVDAKYVPATATALVAVAANYAQFILQSRNGAGGSALGLGTTNTQPVANGGTGNFAGQWQSQALTVTAFDPNNAVIPAGGVLTFQIIKQGSGVVVPGGTMTARIRYI